LHSFRNSLSLSEYPQEIFPGELTEIAVGPAASRQLREQVGKLGHILQPLHYFGDAIEVASDADVIDAGDFAHVLDLIGHL
jgi:hypothetical protein